MFKIYTRFFFFGSKAIPFEEAAHGEYHVTPPPPPPPPPSAWDMYLIIIPLTISRLNLICA